MAGRADALIIPDLAGFRPEWLESSEVSIALDGSRITGLSFFFHDEASCAEFAARESLDERVMSDEKTLRVKFSILPRYWLKIHYDGGRRCGLSHYFDINPGMHYPITSIRCFLRSQGLSDVGMIEELLKPALEANKTRWGLALKRFPEQTVPRIYFSIERPLLKQVLATFVQFGYVSETTEQLYLDWESRITAGRRVYISFDPTLRKLSSLDFCDIPSALFSGALCDRFPEKLDYLKIRISDSTRSPELTAYMPLQKIIPIAGKNQVAF